jgi:hypothetical protein
MKKIIFVLMSISMLIPLSCEQNLTSAPQKVQEMFSERFPTGDKIEWHKESETEWEAEFKMNKIQYSANFLQDGTWQETEHEIEKSDIPSSIKETLNMEFAGYEIEEVEISETIEGKVYEFYIEKGKVELEIAIASDGKLLRKEAKNGDSEKND